MKKINLFLFCLSFTTYVAAQTTDFTPTIKVKALVHSRYDLSLTDSVDVNYAYNKNPVTNNFRMRRIELRTDMQVSEKISGVIRVQLPELKGATPGKVIELAYGEYKFMNEVKLRFGQFKTPFELDELTSHEDLRMIDRGTTSTLFVNNYYSSYQPGLMVFGDLFKEKKMMLSYYLGVFDGSDRSVTVDNNSGKNVVGRIEFTPVKGIRLGVNAQAAPQNDSISGQAAGIDLSINHPLGDKLSFILEGEFIQGTNLGVYNADTTGELSIDSTDMSGYFGQLLFRVKLDEKWCKTFEFGGKYENTDPLTNTDNNAFSTITGTIGFIFLPDNMARLQFNIIHRQWEDPEPGIRLNTNMFVTQLQVKI